MGKRKIKKTLISVVFGVILGVLLSQTDSFVQHEFDIKVKRVLKMLQSRLPPVSRVC